MRIALQLIQATRLRQWTVLSKPFRMKGERLARLRNGAVEVFRHRGTAGKIWKRHAVAIPSLMDHRDYMHVLYHSQPACLNTDRNVPVGISRAPASIVTRPGFVACLY